MMSYSKIIIVNGWVLALVLAGCQNKQKIDRPAAVEAYISAVEARQAGQDAEAIARLEAALAANPNLTMARRLLADLYRETGEYDRARQHYEVTSKIDFYEFENHYFLGLMYQFLDRLQEAAAAYVQALKLNPGDLKSNMNLGLVYLSLNDNPSAVQYLKRAVEIDAGSAMAWANYGVALDSVGEYSQAEQAYRKALELDPSLSVTLSNLGINLLNQNNANEAINVLSIALQRGETPTLRKRLGDAYVAAKRLDEAVAEYRKATELNARFTSAYNELGNTRIRQYREGLELDDSQRIAALAAWEASLKISPNQPKIRQQVEAWSKRPIFGQ